MPEGDGSVRNNKADIRFVVRNDVGALVRAGSFLVAILSVPETKIKGLQEAFLFMSFGYYSWSTDCVGM